MDQDITVVSSNDIEGKPVIEYLGIVSGSIVKSRNAGSDMFASLKSIVGGELMGYSKLLQGARDDAYSRMVDDANSKGANAIIGFRFQTSTITAGASEVVAYGPAVKV
jgi:uncharacterized protein YbjQ (UPF0145 family)